MKESVFVAGSLILGAMFASEIQAGTETQSAEVRNEEAVAYLMKMERDARCGQVLVNCLIDGTPMRMMLDTGATHTVLHEESVGKLKNPRWLDTSRMVFKSNSTQIPKMLVASAQVGPGVSPQHPVIVVNLGAVRGMMAEKIDGIVGMDILGSLPFTFDLRNKTCFWGAPEKVSLVPIPGKRDNNGRLIMQLKSGTKAIDLLLDTGSSVTRICDDDWAPGVAGEITAHIGDVDKVGQAKMIQGKAGSLEVVPGFSLNNVEPLLCPRGEITMLGMDALAGTALIHLPDSDSPYGAFYFAR